MTYFYQLLLLFLPAFVANATPVVVKQLPGLVNWSTPISESVFGINKTYRGVVCGIFAGALSGAIQSYFGVGQLFMTGTIFGSWLGAGALTGDLVKSYFKRRLGFRPGSALPIFDGIDYMVGAIIFALPFYTPNIQGILFLLVFAPIVSLLANCFAYGLGWKSVWY